MSNSEPPSTPSGLPLGPAPAASSTSSAAPTQIAENRREWADLAAQIAGPDPVVETYLQKVGRHNMARLQASEMMRAETAPSTEQASPATTGSADADCPLPPDLPADPTHPLNTDVDLMSDQEYQETLAAWRTTEEYQTPLRLYQAWQHSRST